MKGRNPTVKFVFPATDGVGRNRNEHALNKAVVHTRPQKGQRRQCLQAKM